VTIRLIIKIEYRLIANGLSKPNFLNLLLIRPPILLKTSCNIPSGHKKEQYDLPVITVKKSTTTNPAAAIVPR
jgi:hypothetical protein